MSVIQPRDTADFHIFRDRSGHWCSCRADGLIAGTFFTHDAAIRFAKNECLDRPDLGQMDRLGE